MKSAKNHAALIGIALFIGAVPMALQAQSDSVSGTAAQPRRAWMSAATFGAKLGLANVESINDQTLSYGASVDYPLDRNLSVGATIDYWNKSSIGIEAEQVQMDDLSFGGHARLVFNESSAIRPFALAGLALHRFSVSVAQEREGENPEIDKFRNIDNDVAGKLGLDFGGGVLYRIQNALDVEGEVLWRKLTDASVNFDQLVFSAGLSYSI